MVKKYIEFINEEIKRSTTEDFIRKAQLVHGDRYDYSRINYQTTHLPVEIVCKQHGTFKQSPASHLSGSNCPSCKLESNRIKGLERFSSTTEEFIKKSQKIHGDKFDYSKVEYKNAHTPVKIICKEHGVFEQTPTSHLSGSGCRKCYGRRDTTESFTKKAQLVHGDRFDYSKVNYKNTLTPVEIICKRHGSFLQKPDLHLRGKGCQICRESKGELNVAKSLKNLGIKYIRYFKFDDCINSNNRILIFDFYLPDLNMCIEYDGEQHFRSIDRWGGDETFKKIQQNDKIKDEYCKKKGIYMLRISYHINGYEKIHKYLQDWFEVYL